MNMKKHKIITFSVYNHVLEKYTEHNGAFVSYKTNRWWFIKKWAGILD